VCGEQGQATTGHALPFTMHRTAQTLNPSLLRRVHIIYIICIMYICMLYVCIMCVCVECARGASAASEASALSLPLSLVWFTVSVFDSICLDSV
jgi:hypothetical protein